MESNFARCMKFVFAREGGFVNDPRDPGAATNLGITIATLKAWRGHNVTEDDVRHLKRAEAQQIYHKWYWHPAWCGDLPPGVDLLVFDAAVNMGIEPALNLLRRQIGVGITPKPRGHRRHPPDQRHIGQWAEHNVLEHLKGICAPGVIIGLCNRRAMFYHSLNTFPVFGAGWLKRVELARNLSMHMWATGDQEIPFTNGFWF
jgi:lysozyme family protein